MPEEDLKIINTDSGWRVSQACDRCRIKKVKCDGATPCSKCVASGFDCHISDKLARRSFPKGYTVNLEKRVRELEEEVARLKGGHAPAPTLPGGSTALIPGPGSSQTVPPTSVGQDGPGPRSTTTRDKPVEQIFNLDQTGIIIGNDNLNFESQFNHLLINLRLPFLKITNSHNFLLDDPDLYLYHRAYSNFNHYHNKDLSLIYNPLVARPDHNDDSSSELPRDVYDLFIGLINNFKKIFTSKRDLDNQVAQFFLNYNTFIPIFDYKKFMESYDAFHTMYPFMFTYDDATINGFNLSTNDYQIVNEYLVIVVQIYAMILMCNPALNLNLLLNHSSPSYAFNIRKPRTESLVRSLYDFLPYLNVFHVSIDQLQTYMLFLYYSLLTNNKEKLLLLCLLINAFIGVLGINLNSNNLFFNDLTLSPSQRRDRVKLFWGFKVLLKCFNLKFGFKPTINTTIINPVTIEHYFETTPEKLSLLIDPTQPDLDPLFETLLVPSVEFLTLMNIIIPSSFSPNYYRYLKQSRNGHPPKKSNKLDWILNDHGNDGNDGNLNYNYTQFLAIDKNLSEWRYALQDKQLRPAPLAKHVGLSPSIGPEKVSLYNRISFDTESAIAKASISKEDMLRYNQCGVPDAHSAVQLIKIQLNFHYLVIRSTNYLNFVIDRELGTQHYTKIANIAREVLAYFVMIFEHVGHATATFSAPASEFDGNLYTGNRHMVLYSLSTGLDLDEEGFVVNDFSAKRRRALSSQKLPRFPEREIPPSPFNPILNGLSLTMINLKKSVILQMLYLLICHLKIAKRGGSISRDTLVVLNASISLFMKVFITYKPGASKVSDARKQREDELYNRLIKDELKQEILSESHDSDDEDEIDWDDEEMDEDLKYLKILKYVKYKTNALHDLHQEVKAEPMMTPYAPVHIPDMSEIKLGTFPSLQQHLPTDYRTQEQVKEEELALDLMNMRKGHNYEWNKM